MLRGKGEWKAIVDFNLRGSWEGNEMGGIFLCVTSTCAVNNLMANVGLCTSKTSACPSQIRAFAFSVLLSERETCPLSEVVRKLGIAKGKS